MKIEHALGGLEGLAKSVIDKIISNPKKRLTKEERYTLYVFTMMQEGRTLAQANLIQEVTNSIFRTVAKNILNYNEITMNVIMIWKVLQTIYLIRYNSI